MRKHVFHYLRTIKTCANQPEVTPVTLMLAVMIIDLPTVLYPVRTIHLAVIVGLCWKHPKSQFHSVEAI